MQNYSYWDESTWRSEWRGHNIDAAEQLVGWDDCSSSWYHIDPPRQKITSGTLAELRSRSHRCACRSWARGFQRSCGWSCGTGPGLSGSPRLWPELCVSSSGSPPSETPPLSSVEAVRTSRISSSHLLLMGIQSSWWKMFLLFMFRKAVFSWSLDGEEEKS